MKKFFALFKVRTLEFVRDRGTFFWNLGFPILLVFGFAFALADNDTTLFTVGLIGEPDVVMEFLEIEQIDFVRYEAEGSDSTDAVVERVRRHQLDMAIDFGSRAYYINPESGTGSLLRRMFASASFNNTVAFEEQVVPGEPIRYVDWLLPGVIGMNMMFSCLFGVGFVIVRYRKNGVLKRLKATPVSAFTFVSAQAASRLIIVFFTSVVVYIGTNAFLNFTMEGSFLLLGLITALAIICMISIGLIFASRLRSEELAGGLMNVVSFPMLVLSGVFFSLEGSPPALQNFSQILPLTHFVDGARAIMLEGATAVQIAPNLVALSVYSLALMTVSAIIFRWE